MTNRCCVPPSERYLKLKLKRAKKMLNSIKRFVLDESGLETVEWAIVGGVVVAVCAAVFLTVGQDVSRGMNSLDASTALIP